MTHPATDDIALEEELPEAAAPEAGWTEQAEDAPAEAEPPRRKPTKLEKSGARVAFIMIAFIGLYVAIFARLTQLGIAPGDQYAAKLTAQDLLATARPDILDRNGEVLATDIRVPSLYAEPRKLVDVDEATEMISAAMPELDARDLREKLASKKGFVWLKREITPKQQAAVYKLGLPGVGFLYENKRVYPNGPTLSHVLGAVNIDNQGIAGIEKYIDRKRGLSELAALGYAAKNPDDLTPVQLSIDLRAQNVMRDELVQGIAHFRAKAAAGVLMDVNTGEMISLVSLPDFDPNNPADALDPNRINRINVGVYEMGSTFKALTLAMGIDSGKFTTNSLLDARTSLRFGKWTIPDYHATHRILTLPEVFTHSSNIGSARIALSLGITAHRAFLAKMGQLDRLVTELPENAAPLIPVRWTDLSTATIAFGQGLNVAPLQAVMAVGAMMNGGHLMKPTFLVRSKDQALAESTTVLKPHTSDVMRYLLRLNATDGSAKKVDIVGYQVGGKTGTAEKIVNGRYSKNKDHNFTTFMAVFPFDKPKYLLLTIYDEPKAVPESYGYTTAAWNAGATAGKIITRVAPLLGQQPRFEFVPNNPPPLYAPATVATAQ
ncbi:peptidoglycan D,D-transpeptidase FtsI family protein [Labrys wisconsinensis]|uniref:Cell division protein FtsI (Penicillin-binding protein 3) n=1 Tax=Labrys wisconsinensis TaxID=425677 RepID=A0ABU0JF21_9HYPH|nr:penicillin-binding protein 2 [Labrys wisconsinensis]MDQ0472878.1 cell division protein FtsI (penicillin-binding protein 3) [Labrys wisconsinensis]